MNDKTSGISNLGAVACLNTSAKDLRTPSLKATNAMTTISHSPTTISLLLNRPPIRLLIQLLVFLQVLGCIVRKLIGQFHGPSVAFHYQVFVIRHGTYQRDVTVHLFWLGTN